MYDKVSTAFDALRNSGLFIKLETKYFGLGECPSEDDQGRGPRAYALGVVVARSLFLLVLVLIPYAIAVFIYSKVSGRTEAARSAAEKKGTTEAEGGKTAGDDENNVGANEHEA